MHRNGSKAGKQKEREINAEFREPRESCGPAKREEPVSAERKHRYISVALSAIPPAIIQLVRTRILTSLYVFALCAVGWAQSAGSPTQADRVVVLKKERTLELFSMGKVVKAYKVSLGGDPIGPKSRQGDHKTPEGTYILDSRNPHSRFYKSIHISYPNAEERAAARALGVSPGGDVFIHGLPNGYGWMGASHRLKDWTDGCIAVTDAEMDEIWKAVPNGTPIEIRP